ncbi:ribosome-associated ATPase/putative transporter RbbA [Cereibacter azotoformans]|uniref:ribosome-associated ATPase/putative transporter RbbA n=1 Tax=Cereibacter azotoformans TaxID=43057 RepID=UPI001EEAE290|nr:ribosome-associated ATPase/putative transporter RbbA [Cereibacter azotoformans]ULB11555.1 ribosome-associated ATPase/putative transporter RbbA [Cereibacter azotoformans]
MRPAAEIAGVSHRYGAAVALDEVSLAIPAGCMAGLIGPDGVGKSTLLALIAGVRRLQRGRLSVLGHDLSRRTERQALLPRIAYMPQGLGRNLYPTLTVRENLEFFGRIFGQKAAERHQRIDMLLRATGLDPFPDRPAGKLSGGMKQKLSLCSALIHDPDLLILDEPTTGVDPLSRRQFWELIGAIRGHLPGMSVLVATAYMEEADRFDWLAAMDAGRVIATGSPADLRARTGADTLETAFIRLLPEGADAAPVVLPPRRAQPAATPAIEARNLTKRFGDFTAVDDVSFTIPEGEIFGFLGSNGCGKSTTMKMLTGLQDATEGETRLFGERLAASDMQSRMRIGYMSQGFSLYGELTVRQNLMLHAQLYALPAARRGPRVDEVMDEFDLADVAGQMPESLPLGIRQRLQLAVATIHEPRILILDEPTSGVDPLARDDFWRKLIVLSRERGVTIFITTHFMNEAERCDRISLMHAGKVLEVGAPAEIVARHGAASLEEAFIGCLEDQLGRDPAAGPVLSLEGRAAPAGRVRRALTRMQAYSWRETLELIRDPIRLFFALAAPVILLLTMGYGISFDVDRLSFAVNDQDRSAESRALIEQFSSIRQFDQQEDVASRADLDARMMRGELTVALEIPDGFGRDLRRGSVPEVSFWIDGAMPFRAETARGYATGVLQAFASSHLREEGRATAAPVTVESRFLFNQAFLSANAMVPSIIMLILMLVPAIMAAVSVVREKESGTIANFRSTPVGRAEFLLGKQLPYAVIAWGSFWMLFVVARTLFGVPFSGNLRALALISALYVGAATGFGQLLSSFTRTQVTAVFATSIITIIPTINFSGLIVPVSSLSPAAQAVGRAFPAAWYQPASAGSFVKGFGWAELWPVAAVLAGFCVGYLLLSVLALRKQEA